MVFKRNDNKARILSILSVVFRKVYSYSEMMSNIAQGNLNIRIHRDITGEVWLGDGIGLHLNLFNIFASKNIFKLVTFPGQGFNYH